MPSRAARFWTCLGGALVLAYSCGGAAHAQADIFSPETLHGVAEVRLAVADGDIMPEPVVLRASNCLKTVNSTSAITNQTAIFENH